jgi:predicted DsbA family dithiol-disulfide isomerase
LRRLEEDYGPRLRVRWRSFLLRPRPGPPRDLEKFRAYTQSWLRPAAEDDAPEFQVWQGDAGPPSYSVPPHQVAKAAARLDPGAFDRIHEGLLRAYFGESRDVTDAATLLSLWVGAGLSAADFETREDPTLLDAIRAEHNEAVEFGATGAPALRMSDSDSVILGAQPQAIIRRWIDRTLVA